MQASRQFRPACTIHSGRSGSSSATKVSPYSLLSIGGIAKECVGGRREVSTRLVKERIVVGRVGIFHVWTGFPPSIFGAPCEARIFGLAPDLRTSLTTTSSLLHVVCL